MIKEILLYDDTVRNDTYWALPKDPDCCSARSVKDAKRQCRNKATATVPDDFPIERYRNLSFCTKHNPVTALYCTPNTDLSCFGWYSTVAAAPIDATVERCDVCGDPFFLHRFACEFFPDLLVTCTGRHFRSGHTQKT